MNNVVMMNKEGLYARARYVGGGFGDNEPNNVEFVELDRATVFDCRARRQRPFEVAKELNCTEVPAYEVRKVFIGVNLDA